MSPSRPSKKARTSKQLSPSASEASLSEDDNSIISITSSNSSPSESDDDRPRKRPGIDSKQFQLPDLSDDELDMDTLPASNNRQSLSPIWSDPDAKAKSSTQSGKVEKKRGPGRPRKEKGPEAEPALRKITYAMEIFSFEEMQKPKTKREPARVSLELSESTSFDTFSAKVLAKITSKVSTKGLDISHHDILFSILRVVSKPGLTLSDEDSYGSLLTRVKAVKSETPTVSLHITQTTAPKDDELQASTKKEKEEGGSNGKKRSLLYVSQKKSKAPLPGNVARAEAIKQLQEEWACKDKQPDCDGRYCYVFPPGHKYAGRHLDFNNARFEAWGSGMGKENGTVTVKNPPNHWLFDGTQLRQTSPVVARRAEIRKQEEAAAAQGAVAPMDQVGELRELVTAVLVSSLANSNRAPLANMAVNIPAAPRPPPAAPAASTSLVIKLLGPGYTLGPEMSVSEFGKVFDVSDDTITKLEAQRYSKVRLLRFIEEKDLVDMGLAPGLCAELIDALERWSGTTVSD